MSFSKIVTYSLALLVIAFILPEPTFKSRPRRPLSFTASAASNSTEQQGTESLPLPAPGAATAREISAGETHTYHVRLDARQHLRAVVVPHDADAGVTLYGTDGHARARFGCRDYGPTPVSVIAEVAGLYRLEVRSLDAGRARGRYELRVEALRPATAEDEQRARAEKTFAEAEQLLGEWKAQSIREAILKFTASLPAWRAAGDRRGEALALKRVGDAHQPLGEYRKALALYAQALTLARESKDQLSESEILNQAGYVHLTLGDNREAQKLCARALELSQAAGSLRERARALNNLGEVAYGSGKLQQSLEYYQQALALRREAGDRQGQALTLLNIGYTYSDLARTREAFDFYNQAVSFWKAARNPRGEAATLSAVGRLFSRMGESQESLESFKRAMRLIQPVGDPVEEARIMGGLAYVYDGLGEKRKALEHYDRALRLFRAADYPNGEAGTLFDAGKVHLSLNDNERALECYQQAVSIFGGIGDRRMEIAGLKEIGRVYHARGEGARALDYYLRARAFYHAESDLRGEMMTLNLIGRVHEGAGRTQRARECYERALPLSREAAYPAGEVSTLFNLARVERDRGDLAKARARAEESLAVVESLREKVSSQDLRASYFATVRRQYEFYIDLLMRLHRERPTAGFDRAAFEASERARARSLVETLAAARVGVRRKADPALLEREASLRAELNERAARRTRLRTGGGAQAGQSSLEEEEAALNKEIDELTSRLREVEAEIRADGMEHTATLPTRPLGLGEIQERVVDEGTTLLEYALGEERSYVWAVSRTSIESYELPPRAEVEDAARRVRELLSEPQQPAAGETLEAAAARSKESEERYWREASALGEMLLGPVAARLAGKRLVVVADGALQYVPFGALPAPGRGGGEPVPLMLEHEITSQPSASALAALRAEAAHRRERQSHRQPAHAAPHAVAVFADPVFEHDDSRLSGGGGEAAAVAARQARTRDADVYRALRDAGVTAATAVGGGGGIPRLFASREEAEAIMAVVPEGSSLKATGFGANREAALSPELARYRIIHFATHGVLDSERPELSGLVLSLYDERGNPREGFLRLNDIYNLDLPAEVVVLSACNTGLGKDVKGEGLVGLTRGFMHAGSARVMASLWKVDDEATAELMKHFYRQMLVEKKSPAAALRGAQTAVWQQRRWRAPYFWAAFVLQGEYGGRVEVGEAAAPAVTYRRAGAAAGAALALLVCGCYFIRRKARHGRTHVH